MISLEKELAEESSPHLYLTKHDLPRHQLTQLPPSPIMTSFNELSLRHKVLNGQGDQEQGASM